MPRRRTLAISLAALLVLPAVTPLGGCVSRFLTSDGDIQREVDNAPPIMLDDKQSRIRVIVPNLMGYEEGKLPASYHAFYDPATGVPKPSDGRPVYEGLRPEFNWPAPN